MLSRRTFVGALAASAATAEASQAPLGIYIGDGGGDLSGALHRAAAQGYREIEIAGLRDRRPADLRKLFDRAGVSCKTACWSMWENDADSQDTIDSAVELGLEYLVTPAARRMGKEWFEPGDEARFTVNDWRWNADWFNHVGGLAQKNNLQFVYRVTNVVGFEEMWTRTEPTRVKFELDCTRVDAATFLERYGSRTVLAQVRDNTWNVPEPENIRYRYIVS